MTYAPGAEAPDAPSKHQVADVAAMVNDTSQRMAAWPEQAYRSLGPALAQAQRELTEKLGDWLANVKDGNLRFTYERYAGTLIQLETALNTIKRLSPTVYQELRTFYTPMSQDALAQMTREYARMLDVFGGKSWAPGRIDLDAARIIGARENLLIPRFQTSAARYAGQVIDDIQGELIKGVLTNETYYELTERLVRLGGPTGAVALQGIAGQPGAVVEHIGEGLFKRYRYWAHRLVRTELQRAANLTLDDGIRQLATITPGLMRRWDASVDSRLCGLCFSLHGTTAPIGGTFADGIDTAPAHPNCRCRVGAWRPEWAEYLAWMKEIQ